VGLAQALAEGEGAEDRTQAFPHPQVAPLSKPTAMGDGLMTDHNCYEEIDKALVEKGVRLSMAMQFSPTTGQTLSTPRVSLEVLDSATPQQKRAAKAMYVLATFCPWCAIELERLS
jgi:hypothetical protein